jgi:phosphoribosyl 1,2-cyclic phosphate phosphodiesterase
VKATLTVLGSGTSMGVPTLGCDCAVCRSTDPHDRRTRPSIMIEYGGKVVLIDTSPDFYAQAVREHIKQVDAVFYTHAHADHILGIDDLRPLSFNHKPGKLPLYARPDTAAFLRRMFSYIFDANYKYGSLPQLELRPIDGPVELFGATFEPVRVLHGETEIYGYRFGSAAYLTDHSEVPEASFHQLEGLDIVFLDALRHKPHPTHSTVENSLRLAERLKAKRAFFTHICHDLAHEATNASLPANVRLAYDGMRMEFEISGQ